MNSTEEIKNRLDIVDTISNYLSMTPAGGNFKARCPFHNEKTASFMVSKEKQIWHCFGCDKGGDIISFVQEYEGISFPEALKILAEKAGVTLAEYSGQAKQDYSDLYKINQLAADYFQGNLKEKNERSNKVNAYLVDRGVKDTSIDKWQLGLSNENWDDLLQNMTRKGFNEEQIFQAGLIVKKKSGSGYVDRFRRRLMFPLCDNQGRVVAFTSRTLNGITHQEEDFGGKYINSPQTAIYDKSRILYGWHLAKDAIRQKKYLIIVEGNMDAILAHQVGTANVVAVSGTALTSEHIKLIKRYCENVILAYDGDAAGTRAAFRSVALGWKNEMNIKILLLTKGKDPADMIKTDKASWLAAVKNSVPVMDYYFKRIIAGVDLNRADHKKIAVGRLLPIIKFLKSKVEQAHYLQALSDKLQIPVEILQADLVQAKSFVETDTQQQSRPTKPKDKPSPLELLTESLLALSFFKTSYLDTLIRELEPDMVAEQHRDLYRKLIVYYTKHQNLSGFSQSNDISEQEKNSWIKLSILGEKDYGQFVDKELANNFEELVSRLKSQSIATSRQDLIARLRQAELDNDTDKQDMLIHKINLLNKEISK